MSKQPRRFVDHGPRNEPTKSAHGRSSLIGFLVTEELGAGD